MSDKTFYITTAISYPNGKPHIGHGYELIATDAIARFKRLDGYDVCFLTGTDEHGIKMLKTARDEGIDVRELADRNAVAFQDMARALGGSHDDFIRTTEERHHKASQAIWRRMADAGDIYKDTYSGWYSVRDEAYYDEDETELQEDGSRLGPQDTPVEWQEEENYLFRLSAYQDRLLALYEENPDFIGPAERRNEVTAFVRSGLRDLSVSRTTFDWGIPVPGDEKHVMYVWVDALTNYLTALGYPDETYEHWHSWPEDVLKIGKDIERFHAIYWTAFLMSAGLPLPNRVFGHCFLLNKGEKMSKSIGNVLDPIALAEHFGVEQLRYFLLREVPFGKDGTYSEELIINRINADLANDLGNLAQRSLSMIGKNCDGHLPAPGAFGDADKAILRQTDALLETCRTAIDRQRVNVALDAVWDVVGETNRYFAEQEPWALKKTDPERMGTVLYVTAEIIRQVAILAQPIMPDACSKLLDLLALDQGDRSFLSLGAGGRLASGVELPKPSGVFPRYIKPEEGASDG